MFEEAVRLHVLGSNSALDRQLRGVATTGTTPSALRLPPGEAVLRSYACALYALVRNHRGALHICHTLMLFSGRDDAHRTIVRCAPCANPACWPPCCALRAVCTPLATMRDSMPCALPRAAFAARGPAPPAGRACAFRTRLAWALTAASAWATGRSGRKVAGRAARARPSRVRYAGLSTSPASRSKRATGGGACTSCWRRLIRHTSSRYGRLFGFPPLPLALRSSAAGLRRLSRPPGGLLTRLLHAATGGMRGERMTVVCRVQFCEMPEMQADELVAEIRNRMRRD